jgi:hypothetical protein
MFKQISWSYRGLAIMGLGLGLAACGSSDIDLKKYAADHNMSATKEAAFTTCYSDFKRSAPVLTTPEGNVRMRSVPADVCACEADAMMEVLKDDQFLTFSTFTLYMSREEKKNPARFYAKALKPGYKPTDAAKKLETAFLACVDDYKKAHADEAKRLFQVIPPKDDSAKKTVSAS